MVNQYTKENVAKVYIYLKDPFVKRLIREEKTTIIMFVGSLGGLLGLFLGFSFISFIEIIYLCLLALASKIGDRNSTTLLARHPRIVVSPSPINALLSKQNTSK